MIRVALDSDVLSDIPAGLAPIVLTYADLVPTVAALAAFEKRHRGSQVVLIDRGLGDPLGLASVADVETGAIRPGDLPAWFDRKTRAGIKFLTVYSNRSTLPIIDAVLKGTGHENHYRWVATLDGTCFIAGMPALRRPAVVQILDAGSVGLHCDLSLVLEPAWHPAA